MNDRIGVYKLGKRREVTPEWYTCDAVDDRLGRAVVMKVLTATLDQDARARFHREAKALMAVEHPSIVMVYDYSGKDEETPYLVFEALQGPTLEALAKTKGQMPDAVHTAIFLQLTDALAALHDKGVVHGAFSPANVHLEAEGRAVISNFSLAVAEGTSEGTLAARGTAIVAAPLFIPPEQLQKGLTRSAAADVYALAMTMTWAWLGGAPLDTQAPDAAQLVHKRKFKRAGDVRPDIAHQLTSLVDRIVHTDQPSTRPTARALNETLAEHFKKTATSTPESAVRNWLTPQAKDPAGEVERLLAQGDHDGALIAATGGRYRELSPLGAGNMGRVTRAKDTRLSRDVAIKTILDPTGDKDAIMRFHREARAMGRLRHPNIVEVIDYSGRGAPLPYLVLEFLDAATLRAALDVTAFSEDVALCVLHAICEALTLVHEQGLVHRDVKPENVFLCGDGRVVVADFGIVRGMAGQDANTFVRASTQAIGSPAFASPEQVFDPDSLTGASDMFALGSLLHALLTGESPYAAGNPVDTVRRLQEDKRAALPPKTSPFIAKLSSQLLSRKPGARPSAAETSAMIATELARRGVVDYRHAIRVFLGEEREDTRLSSLVTRIGKIDAHDATQIGRVEQTQIGQTQVGPTTMAQKRGHKTTDIDEHAPADSRTPRLLIGAALVASIVVIGVVAVVTRPRARPAAQVAQAGQVVQAASQPAAPVVALPEPPPPERPPELPQPPPPDPPSEPGPAPKRVEPPPKKREDTSNKPGVLRVVTKPWAKVSIDGDYKGNTPSVHQWQLPAGRHTVLLDNPAFKKQMITIELQGGESREIKVELQK